MQKFIDFHTCPPVPLVVAHRGARGHAPENTLTAAALGYAVQADLWELDANYTKDGKLVVMHDDTLVRTTDVETAFPGRPSYRVCDFTLDEIKSLDAGSWYAGRDQFGRVAAGDAAFSPRLAGFVLDAFGTGEVSTTDTELDLLSAREQEVMRLIARGYTYKEVAHDLFISIKTVETHVSAVLRKLQLSNRNELTRWAMQRHIV